MSKARAFPELSEKEEEALKAEARQKSLDDLHYFTKYMLGFDRLTDHYHKSMCMDVDAPGYKFKLLLHPRGHYKSTVASESYSILKLLRDPNERILITNAKLDNSQKFLRSIASQFNQNSRFRWAWRDWWINQYADNYTKAERGDKLDWLTRNTQNELTVLRPGTVREASITAASIDSSMVSQHYGLIIADDLINREWVRTQEMVEKSILYFKDLLDLLDPDGEMVVIGTRWSHADLYAWILEEFGRYAHIRAPEGTVEQHIYDEAEEVDDTQKNWMVSIWPTSVEKPIFPEEFDSEVLNGLLHAKGPYEFGSQYLLDPTPAEQQKFQVDWINWLDELPDISDMNIVITVDPAISLEDHADRTAILVCGYDAFNNMYLLDGINERVTEDELLDNLYDLAYYYSEKGRFLLPIGFEAIGFQQTYIYNFQRMMMERGKFFAVEEVKRRSRTTKEERILRLVPRLKSGFYAPRSLKKRSARGEDYDLIKRLIWELTKFPFAGFDDLADALADQLDIVSANKLPKASPVRKKTDEREFIHPSILQDQKRRAKTKTQNVGVVK